MAIMPGSRAAKVFLAQLYYDTGKEGKAKKLLIEVVDRWPDVLAAVSLLCRIYKKQGDMKSAEAISRKVSYYYPDSPFVQKMADSYVSVTEKEAEVFETPAETEINEEIEDGSTGIVAQEAAIPLVSSQSASSAIDSSNGSAMTGEKRKTLAALESMLDRITMIRNEKVA
ncbi:hypothetical protein MNBD_NITROSPINAE04-2016 [hydrothermal vent metagenome]|uniref:Uncharacterized protein n=1 Tax=hydrothermal vent metagenome TaxID=652676 RepID=A0A3B1CEN9_9ZZZZ